jgi:hypothetical protein
MTGTIRLPAGFTLDKDAGTIRLPDGFVLEQQPSTAESATDFASQIPIGFNKGLNAVLSAPGAVAAWGAEKLGASAETADKLRFKNPASDILTAGAAPQTKAGRFGEAIGNTIGASAIPSGAILAAAPRIAAAGQVATGMTPTRSAIQNVAEGIAAAPRTAAAYDLAGATASGAAAQAAQEGGFGPAGQMIAGMAGAVAPGATVAGVSGARSAISRARANQGEAGAYGSVVDDIGRPVRDFASDLAVGGSRANGTTNARTMEILGEEMARANGDRQAALAQTITRISSENNITPQAAQQHIRRLSEVHESSPLMLGEYPAVARSDTAQRMRQPGNIDMDELGRVQPNAVQSSIDYLANNGNAQSAQNIRQAVTRRQEDLAPNFRAVLEEIGPQTQTGPRTQRPMLIEDTAQQLDAARQVATQEYRVAHRGPVNNRVAQVWVPRMLDATRSRAMSRAGDARTAINRAVDQFYVDGPNGQPLAMMSLQQLQDARGVVRGQIAGYRTAGRNDLVNAVQPFYDQMTRLMTRMSPQWASANRRWADMEFERVAQQLGDAFATKASPRYREHVAEFRAMAPEAQDITRVHFLQKMYDKLDNAGDTQGLSRMFASDQARNMIRELFGPQAAVTFARAVRNQRVAEQTGAMLGNSRTHVRGVMQRQKDTETGIVTAIQQGSVQNVRNWLMERAAQVLTEGRNGPLSQILATPLSDTAKIAEHVHRLLQQEARLRELAQPRNLPLDGFGARAGTIVEQREAAPAREKRTYDRR